VIGRDDVQSDGQLTATIADVDDPTLMPGRGVAAPLIQDMIKSHI
jgi:hypothetical protein